MLSLPASRGTTVLRTLFLSLFSAALILFAGCKSNENPTDNSGTPAPEQDEMVYNVAGVAGQAGGGGNGGPATEALLYWPQDGLVGPSGEIYIMDWNNHCVRLVGTDGMISRIIGAGILGDESSGPAADIHLNHPTGIVIGPDGNYYMSAWHNWKVKMIDAVTMMTSIAAGTSQGLLGDDGPATAAKMDLPSSAVFDAAGNMYISDQGNQRIRKVDTQGIITTFAGSDKGYADGIGSAAQFSVPKGSDAVPGGKITISMDKQFLYLADTENNRIRKISIATAEVTTIAGTGAAGYSGDGGAAINATLNYPTDVEYTHEDEIYVADSRNNVIRKIDLTTGIITTAVGTGVAGVSPNGTAAESAMLNVPSGIWFDNDTHTLYIADTFNYQVKRVRFPD